MDYPNWGQQRSQTAVTSVSALNAFNAFNAFNEINEINEISAINALQSKGKSSVYPPSLRYGATSSPRSGTESLVGTGTGLGKARMAGAVL